MNLINENFMMEKYVYRNKTNGKYYSSTIFYDVELEDADRFDADIFLFNPYMRDYIKIEYMVEFKRIRRNKLRKLENI